MISVRKATDADIRAAASRIKDNSLDDGNLISRAISQINNGLVLSLVGSDGIVGCVVGGYILWNGVAHCWAITTDSVDKNPLGYTRAVNRIIVNGMRTYGLHRVEIMVNYNYQAGHRWAEALKFEPEGLLKKFGPDKSDFVVYGRTL